MFRRPLTSVSSVLMVVIAAGCATPASQVRIDKVEGPLPQCQSFGWLAAPGDAASLTEQRVRAEVMQALQAKGYAQVDEKPDCRITYQFSSTERPKSGPSVGVGAGGGSRGGVGGGIGISLPIGRKNAQTGTFTLDVVDASRNAQVWSGAVDTETESAELTEAEAKSVVDKVLAEYPDRAAVN